MSEKELYAAIITITLPQTGHTATANVTLHPSDVIQTGKTYKRLRDCTLADLQKFAQAWEADVWETYQQINLLALEEDEAVDVEVKVAEPDGKIDVTSFDWLQDAVLLLDEEPAPEAKPIEEIEVVDSTEPKEETAVRAYTTPATETPSQSTLDEPNIRVSQPEPVYEERESSGEYQPQIAQSQARVRIMGETLSAGSPTSAAVDILMDEPALRAAQAHALSSLSREVAGVLLGPPPEKQPDGRYVVHVIDTIVAKHTVMNGASVTYTPESWRYMNDKLREKYPNEEAVIVGWYHTHPGFGIFLSGMDLFIHQNFFTQIWHIAQVLDPVARTSGFFCWNRAKTKVQKYDFAWPGWASKSW